MAKNTIRPRSHSSQTPATGLSQPSSPLARPTQDEVDTGVATTTTTTAAPATMTTTTTTSITSQPTPSSPSPSPLGMTSGAHAIAGPSGAGEFRLQTPFDRPLLAVEEEYHHHHHQQQQQQHHHHHHHQLHVQQEGSVASSSAMAPHRSHGDGTGFFCDACDEELDDAEVSSLSSQHLRRRFLSQYDDHRYRTQSNEEDLRDNGIRSQRSHPVHGNRHTVAHFPVGALGRRSSDGDLVLSDEMTLKDRQEAINQSHPFGIRLWKPALYKKTRTIENLSYLALHETPLQATGRSFSDWHLYAGNVVYCLLFGWWMAVIYTLLSLCVLITTFGSSRGRSYAALVFEMARYLLWPFGSYVERVAISSPFGTPTLGGFTEDHTSTSATECEPLLGTDAQPASAKSGLKSWISAVRTTLLRLGQMGFADWVFYIWLIVVVTPLQLFVSTICWLLVVSIPMAKLNFVLLKYLYREPLQIHFSGSFPLFRRTRPSPNVPGEIILCTYKAFALQYYKYTYDGINILFINLLPVVFFALFDGFFLAERLGHQGVGHPLVIFVLCLISVLPLAYFIGMAVASISSQSSFGTYHSMEKVSLYT